MPLSPQAFDPSHWEGEFPLSLIPAGSNTFHEHCGGNGSVIIVKDYQEEAGRLFKMGDVGQVPYTPHLSLDSTNSKGDG